MLKHEKLQRHKIQRVRDIVHRGGNAVKMIDRVDRHTVKHNGYLRNYEQTVEIIVAELLPRFFVQLVALPDEQNTEKQQKYQKRYLHFTGI